MARIRFARTFATLAIALSAAALSPSAAQAESPDLDTELYNAVLNYGFYKTPEYLAPIKQLLGQGITPVSKTLAAAIDSRRPEVLDLLLAKTKDINTPISSNGETLLTFALSHSRPDENASNDVKIITSLIKAGADVNAVARSRTVSPLSIAASGSSSTPPNPVMVKLLLASGADAKKTLGNDFTPLTGSAATNLEIVQLLIGAGANPYQVTQTGTTPLHYVCQRTFGFEDKPDPQAAQRIALLLKKGSSIDAMHGRSGTPLLEAARSRNPDCVAALLAAGANPGAPAFSQDYLKIFPETQQTTVQGYVQKNAKGFEILYSPEVVKLFQ